MKITTNQNRLCELFDADPRNDTAIAAELNVSKQALSAWRNGSRSPKKSVLVDIAKMYNVSLEWLMGFDVPKNNEPIDASPVSFSIATDEARIISGGIDKLPKEQRERALNMFRIMFEPQYADLFTKENEEDDT